MNYSSQPNHIRKVVGKLWIDGDELVCFFRFAGARHFFFGIVEYAAKLHIQTDQMCEHFH